MFALVGRQHTQLFAHVIRQINRRVAFLINQVSFDAREESVDE